MTAISIEIPDAAIGQYVVYILRDGNGDVLYVGRSRNVAQRLRSHRSKPWWTRVRDLEVIICGSLDEVRRVEKETIGRYRPDGNSSDFRDLPPSVQVLPQWTVAILREMRDAAETGPRAETNRANGELNAYINALRETGWTLAVVGQAMAITREAVRIRQARATWTNYGPGVPPLPVKPEPEPKARIVRPAIPEDVLADMRELMKTARSVNGATPADDPRRLAGELFLAKVMEQMDAGVTVYTIAKQLEVTHAAIYSRLIRHGHRETTGSSSAFTPYLGRPRERSGRCHRGHEYTVTDGGTRYCKPCDKARGEAYRARQAVA